MHMKRLITVVLFHRDGERKKYEKKIGARARASHV